MTPTVAVGIVHHKEPAPLPFESDERVLVASRLNAASDGSTPWRGFAENQNALMDELPATDWYVALNPDVNVTRDDVLGLVEFAERNDCCIAGPAIRTPWSLADRAAYAYPSPAAWFAQTVLGTARTERAYERRRAGQPAWVTGACMAIRRSGPATRFDERFFLYFEDVELCLRALRAGGRVGFCSDVIIEHETGWSVEDPLRWRRGVEFARSALRFAEVLGTSRALMRAAGLARFGSRVPLRRGDDCEPTGIRCVTHGFLRPGAPGLAEFAAASRAAA